MLRILSESVLLSSLFFFFLNDTATTEIYTLSLHDALPILYAETSGGSALPGPQGNTGATGAQGIDRKSTRLNSSHTVISYAVFCLKKNKQHARMDCGPLGRRHRGRPLRPARRDGTLHPRTPAAPSRTAAAQAPCSRFFFFNDPAPPEISPLPLPAPLPI